ncbi:hypothetical protein [Anaerocolumna sp. MB42-C2]|uniref:hypothetical protein n=1 Tax=Anaerocolumna sp. MB42-C2 TaxID=3070997 RepID=UPI0027E1C985|nr:hypothetical protein [Anaerocolumna sp. MB42-C2]WMJ87138.1 hypothetical protein RBU59_24370 [Anaerocolumna sp. MB42-C2]
MNQSEYELLADTAKEVIKKSADLINYKLLVLIQNIIYFYSQRGLLNHFSTTLFDYKTKYISILWLLDISP